MKRVIHNIIILIFGFCAYLSVYAQTTSNIIDLHKQNLIKLYEKRGAPPEWVKTGNVDEDYIIKFIKRYSKKTAILIYSHKDDTLSLTLFNQERENLNLKTAITKTDLIEAVNDVNHYFTQGNKEVPLLRGAIPVSKNKKNLESNYKSVNQLLLPEAFKLSRYQHLIIVPVFNISTLPFSAFKVDNNYLIDIMSYSIAPSLFELMVSNEVNGKDDLSGKISYTWNNALFVANPEYTNDSIWQFPNLPGTIKEVNSITKSLDPKAYTLLTGEEATKTNITKNICDYDLLYFATHGISNVENPMENSFLALTPSKDSSPYFTLSEIMNTRKNCLLKAELVVLSACQTGLGLPHEGGIIGLARAFQIAGANHVVMSLWNIDDAKTAIFMSFFFEELKKSSDMMPHEGLRQAIFKFKSEINSDPKYWAAFSIFGVPY
jgi:CHAT domain-containing protein